MTAVVTIAATVSAIAALERIASVPSNTILFQAIQYSYQNATPGDTRYEIAHVYITHNVTESLSYRAAYDNSVLAYEGLSLGAFDVCNTSETSIYCIPNPCHLLEMNYFWRNGEHDWKKTLQLSADNKMVQIVGTSNCGPMTGYILQQYDENRNVVASYPGSVDRMATLDILGSKMARPIENFYTGAIPYPMDPIGDVLPYRIGTYMDLFRVPPIGRAFGCKKQTLPPPGNNIDVLKVYAKATDFPSPWSDAGKKVWTADHCDLYSGCAWIGALGCLYLGTESNPSIDAFQHTQTCEESPCFCDAFIAADRHHDCLYHDECDGDDFYFDHTYNNCYRYMQGEREQLIAEAHQATELTVQTGFLAIVQVCSNNPVWYQCPTDILSFIDGCCKLNDGQNNQTTYNLGPYEYKQNFWYPSQTFDRIPVQPADTAACDCRNSGYEWRCQQYTYAEAVDSSFQFGVAKLGNAKYKQEFGTDIQSAMFAVCGYAWNTIMPDRFPTIGLFVPPTQSTFTMYLKDFLNTTYSSDTMEKYDVNARIEQLATLQMPSQEVLKEMVNLKANAEVLTFENGNCIQPPYGQKHPSAFEPDARHAYFPPGKTTFLDESLVGYCQNLSVSRTGAASETPINALPYCANDPLTFSERAALCSNPLSQHIYMSWRVQTRGFDASCDHTTKVCLLIPLATSPETIFESDAIDGYTVLITPFNALMIYFYGGYRYKHKIGAFSDTEGFLSMHNVSDKNEDVDGNPVEWLPWNPDIFHLFDDTTGTVDEVIDLVTEYYNTMLMSAPCTATESGTPVTNGYKLPPKEGTKETYQCVPESELTTSIDWIDIKVKQNVIIRSAHRSIPVVFNGTATTSAQSCVRFAFQYGGSIDASVHFVQNTGRCGELPAYSQRTPVIFTGVSAVGVSLSYSVVGAELPVEILGSNSDFFPARDTIEIRDVNISLTSTEGALFAGIVVAARGAIRFDCPVAVTDQRAYTPGICSVYDLSGGSMHIMNLSTARTDHPIYVLNVTEITLAFGRTFDAQLFKLPPHEAYTPLEFILFYICVGIISANVLINIVLFSCEHLAWKSIARHHNFYEFRSEHYDILPDDNHKYHVYVKTGTAAAGTTAGIVDSQAKYTMEDVLMERVSVPEEIHEMVAQMYGRGYSRLKTA